MIIRKREGQREIYKQVDRKEGWKEIKTEKRQTLSIRETVRQTEITTSHV